MTNMINIEQTQDTTQELADELAEAIFGLSRDDARDKGVCIQCRKKPKFLREEDVAEYELSCLCPRCYSGIMRE